MSRGFGAADTFDSVKDIFEEKKSFTHRVWFAALLVLVLIGLLVARLAQIQIFQHDYYVTRADENRMRLVPVAPVRGLIFDRNGVLLAQNQPNYVLEITPENVDGLDATLARLAEVVRLTDGDIARFKERMRRTQRYRAVPLRTNLSMEEVARYEINRYDFTGVDVSAQLERDYPMGEVTSHLIGYVGGISDADYATLTESDYQGLTQIGKSGIERSHENDLRGTPGNKIVEARAGGRPVRELDYHAGKAGEDLYLSIDAKLQSVAENAFGDLNGAAVAINPKNGEVLAMVSKPGFAPAPFVEGIDNTSYHALLDDPDRPLYNRALLGHGWIALDQAIAQSCDVYFYQAALNLGIDRIDEILSAFGFGHVTGIDIPNEKAGILPSREWKRRVYKQNWYMGETVNMGVGQGYFTVTPVELAQAVARMAMHGAGFKPHLVHAMRDANGDTAEVTPEPLEPIKGIDDSIYQRVIKGMTLAMQPPLGTARAVFSDAPYTCAGKTGTAQVAGLKQDETYAPKVDNVPKHLRDHALFIAFAPLDDPQIAVAVVAEHSGFGATSAAPIARQMMDQYLLGKVLYHAPAANLPAADEEPADDADADQTDEPKAPPIQQDAPAVPQD
jgi:penicillin-binding protein 2